MEQPEIHQKIKGNLNAHSHRRYESALLTTVSFIGHMGQFYPSSKM